MQSQLLKVTYWKKVKFGLKNERKNVFTKQKILEVSP